MTKSVVVYTKGGSRSSFCNTNGSTDPYRLNQTYLNWLTLMTLMTCITCMIYMSYMTCLPYFTFMTYKSRTGKGKGAQHCCDYFTDNWFERLACAVTELSVFLSSLSLSLFLLGVY